MGTLHTLPTGTASTGAREAIAAELDAKLMVCAAALVRTGAPAASLEKPLVFEIASRFGHSGSWRMAMTALVVAWTQGRDAEVLRALDRWESSECADCAVASIEGRGTCRSCAEVG
jgi:hypothetical protein